MLFRSFLGHAGKACPVDFQAVGAGAGHDEFDRLKGLTMYVVQQGRLKKKLDPGEIYRKGRLYVPLTSKEMKALRNGKLSIFIYNKGNVKGDHVTSKVKKK